MLSALTRRKTHFCVLADLVEQADISLIAGHRDPTGFGCCGGGEIVLGSILLELTLYQFVPSHSRIYSEESVVRYISESRLSTHSVQ